MRCKPGDLAVIVRSDFLYCIGRLVEVISWDIDEQEWLVKPISPIPGALWEGDQLIADDIPPSMNEQYFYDDWLRPIRNPNEDARDETLDWLPVPTTKPAVSE